MDASPLITFFNTIIPMNESEIHAVNSLFEECSFSKGELVVEEKQVCNNLFFLSTGYMRLFLFDDVEEVTTVVAGPGEFIAPFSDFLARTVSSECLQTITSVQAFSITFENLQLLYRDTPRFERIGRIIIENYFINKDQRVHSFLKDTAEARYKELMTRHPDYFKHVPLRYIASALGISPETLSRLRARIIS